MTQAWWRDACQPLDNAAMDQARARQQQLTKPAGSLGQLEALAIQLAGLQGLNDPRWIRLPSPFCRRPRRGRRGHLGLSAGGNRADAM